MEKLYDYFEESNSVVSRFYGGIPEIDVMEYKENFRFDIASFASMSMESVYVIDFGKRCFDFVSGHSLFLCGYSRQDVLRMGYGFYSEVVFPTDFNKFAKIHRAVLNRLLISDDDVYKINYFAFTLKIKEYPQFGQKRKYVTVYHKIKPIFVDGKIRYGICMLNSSVANCSDNLRVYYNDYFFDEYSDETGKWKGRKEIEYLTEQELIIIKLAEQGLTDKEIADELCMSYGGIKNIITKLFKKLHVNSMLQAVNVVINNLMLFNPVVKRNTYKATPKKRNYHPLTAERIVNIQQRLDNGQSISSIAKKEKTSRTNIYNAINSGKLIFEKKT